MRYKLLFLFILFTQFVKADAGPPWIQAVCRITLTNGKTIDGFIKLAIGGNGIWINGFNVEELKVQPRQDQQIFFDLDFRSIHFTDSTIECSTIDKSNKPIIKVSEDRQIKLFEWIEDFYKNKEDSIVNINNNELHYRLKDSLIIYYDLTLQSFLDTMDILQNSKNRIGYSIVGINQIRQFELIINPDKIWLDKIEKAKNNFHKYDNSVTGDWQPAAWFHEFVTNKESYDEYQPIIKRNINEFQKLK
ncbi:hypothetical protein [Flavobacterium sp.]|uniref:hypothetical protein n=1 Tax=Flavobacterium sp. TaxID=239 RepID=UPI00374DA898